MKKFCFVSVFFLLLTSCAENKSKEMVFALTEITQSDFKACQEKPCPKINLGYLVAEGKGEVATKINQTLNERRIKILHLKQDEPFPDSIETATKDFIASYQLFKRDFPEFPAGYEVQISDEVANRSEKIIVIKTEYYLFTGGAHGYGATIFQTFSLETGKLLEAKDLFKDLKAFTEYAEKKFRKKYSIPEGENINSTGFFFENDVFSLPENLAILKENVVLIYNPYEAASYANGKLVLEFPKTEVKQWLSDK